MFTLRVIFLFFGFVMFWGHARADAEHISTVRGWMIYFDSDDGKHCYAFTGYKGGTSVGLSRSGDEGDWSFIIKNDRWSSLQAGKTYNITFIFNDRRKWTGKHDGIQNGIRGSHLKEQFVGDIAKSSVIEMRYRRKKVERLSLKGTRAAISSVNECYDNRIKLQDPFADEDPFADGETVKVSNANTQEKNEDNTGGKRTVYYAENFNLAKFIYSKKNPDEIIGTEKIIGIGDELNLSKIEDKLGNFELRKNQNLINKGLMELVFRRNQEPVVEIEVDLKGKVSKITVHNSMEDRFGNQIGGSIISAIWANSKKCLNNEFFECQSVSSPYLKYKVGYRKNCDPNDEFFSNCNYIRAFILSERNENYSLNGLISVNSPKFIGRCHMDICTHYKIGYKKIVNGSSKDSTTVGLLIKYGESKGYAGNSSINWNINFGATYIMCSIDSPAIIWENGGKIHGDVLNVTAPYGAIIASTMIYQNACHDSSGLSEKVLSDLGYPTGDIDWNSGKSLEDIDIFLLSDVFDFGMRSE